MELSLDMKKYHTEMREEEDDARSCYNKDLFKWSDSKDFQKMLLLDSSFIFFILFVMDVIYQRRRKSQSMTWYITDVRKHMKQIKLDLLIPDNQIPFFAIKKLIECIPNRDIFFSADQTRLNVDSSEDSAALRYFEELALQYFDDIWPKRNKKQKMIDETETEFDHLLHLFHWSRIPTSQGYKIDIKKQGSKNISQQYIPSATELKKSATKLKNTESSSDDLHITFQRSVIKILAVINVPTLYLYDYSEEIFQNLIAFELTPTNQVRCFITYSACMSCLLQRKDDVKLLRESGIIASTAYNDEDVVKFFKYLNRDVEGHLVPDDLLHLYDRVMEHHNSPISRWYGNFSWVRIAVPVGYLFSLVTLVECVYIILSYQVLINNK